MGIYLPYLHVSFEDRLWQIAAVMCAAKKNGQDFALFNGMPPAVNRVLSASLRNIMPFAETAWPSVGLPLVPFDGKPTKTVTESPGDPFDVPVGVKDAVLFVGSFRDRKYLENREDYIREAFRNEPPFTFASVPEEVQRVLSDCYFAHMEGVLIDDLDERAVDKNVVVFSASPRETKGLVSDALAERAIFASDRDRAVALHLMIACSMGPLPGLNKSDLAFWAELMGCKHSNQT